MRTISKAVRILVVLGLGASVAYGKGGPAPPDSQNSIVIVFKDGRKQSFPVADIARIEFKAQVVSTSAEQTNEGATVGRNHFLGKWKVGTGSGGTFYITLDPDGQAKKSIGSSHGTWAFVDGEARISWDDGWHDIIRKVGSKHEKFAYAPGKSYSDEPSNVADARNTHPQPI